MARPKRNEVRQLCTWDETRGCFRFRMPATGDRDDRKRIYLDGKSGRPLFAREDESKAEAYALRAVTLLAGRVVAAGAGETVGEYADRYYQHVADGTAGTRNNGRPQKTAKLRLLKFNKYFRPRIGSLVMVDVTARDLRPLVVFLNQEITARRNWHALKSDTARSAARIGRKGRKGGTKPGLQPKAARNIWGEITAMFAEAANSRIPSLLVREGDNPAKHVRPPYSATDRDQTTLVPSEVTRLLSCTDVPTARREVYALAIYTGLREAELRGLAYTDVDLRLGVIYVRHQQQDAGGEFSDTKTSAGYRQVFIEPNLRPLLVRLVAAKRAPLVRVPRSNGPDAAAELIRNDLRAAGCTRSEINADTSRLRPFTFHALRATCATHWANGRYRGDVKGLMSALGHEDFKSTNIYINNAQPRETFGEPHPPFEIEMGQEMGNGIEKLTNHRKNKREIASPEGFEETFGCTAKSHETPQIQADFDLVDPADAPITGASRASVPPETGDWMWLVGEEVTPSR